MSKSRLILILFIFFTLLVGYLTRADLVLATHACGWHIPFPPSGTVVAGPIAPDWNPFNGLFDIVNEYCGQYRYPDGQSPTVLNAYQVGDQICIKQDVSNLTGTTVNMNSYFDVFRVTDFRDGTDALDWQINRSQYDMEVQNSTTGTTQAQIYYNLPVVNKDYPPGTAVTDTFCWPAGHQNAAQTDGSDICGYFQFDLFHVPLPVGAYGNDNCGIQSCATSGFVRVVGCGASPTPTPTPVAVSQCQQVNILRGGTQIQAADIKLGDTIIFRGFASATNTTVSKIRFTITKGGVAQTPVEVPATLVGSLYQADYQITADLATSYSVTAEAVSP